jgi:hypothetical protein
MIAGDGQIRNMQGFSTPNELATHANVNGIAATKSANFVPLGIGMLPMLVISSLKASFSPSSVNAISCIILQIY